MQKASAECFCISQVHEHELSHREVPHGISQVCLTLFEFIAEQVKIWCVQTQIDGLCINAVA